MREHHFNDAVVAKISDCVTLKADGKSQSHHEVTRNDLHTDAEIRS
jgi:hypothetical protein